MLVAMLMNLFNICFLYSTHHKKNYSQKLVWRYVTLRNQFFSVTNVCMWFPANCMLEIGKHMNLLDCPLCIDLKMNKKQIYCIIISCKLKNSMWRYVTVFVTLRNICTFRSLDMDLVTSYDARRQFFHYLW